MEKIINIYKPLGLTPVQLIQKLRGDRKEYQGTKIGFAGRLDPLAHGVMLLMIDEETKKRDRYLDLPKTYEFEVLFGISTDTYDALGLIASYSSSEHSESKSNNLAMKQYNNLSINSISLEKKIKQFIKSKHGKHTQVYPPFSSREVNGKPLYQWARENRLEEIQVPSKEIEVYNFDFLNLLEIPADEIHKRIISNINSVDGDFRQEKILKTWNNFFSLSPSTSLRVNMESKSDNFYVAKLKINCSSGTYVRSLANDLGKTIGTGAIALDIFRTKVGNYMIEDSIRL